MALRLRRRIKLPGGLSLNVGKTGVGVSGGIRGARIGVNKRGVYNSVGIPGTGVSSMQYIGKGKATTMVTTSPARQYSLVKIALIVIFFPFVFTYFLIKFLIGLVAKK